jgi:hypothetical protein
MGKGKHAIPTVNITRTTPVFQLKRYLCQFNWFRNEEITPSVQFYASIDLQSTVLMHPSRQVKQSCNCFECS